MGVVIAGKGAHTWYKCKCDRWTCQFCGGGLGHCTVCDGFEGTLPTECPGTKISTEDQELIYNGTLDFRNGQWLRRPCQEPETPDVRVERVVDAAVRRLNHRRFCQFCGETLENCTGGGLESENPAHDFTAGGISKEEADGEAGVAD